MNLSRIIDCSGPKEAPISGKDFEASEKSTGQYLLEALTRSRSPPDFKAFAMSYEQKYPRSASFCCVQSKSDSCLNSNL